MRQLKGSHFKKEALKPRVKFRDKFARSADTWGDRFRGKRYRGIVGARLRTLTSPAPSRGKEARNLLAMDPPVKKKEGTTNNGVASKRHHPEKGLEGNRRG